MLTIKFWLGRRIVLQFCLPCTSHVGNWQVTFSVIILWTPSNGVFTLRCFKNFVADAEYVPSRFKSKRQVCLQVNSVVQPDLCLFSETPSSPSTRIEMEEGILVILITPDWPRQMWHSDLNWHLADYMAFLSSCFPKARYHPTSLGHWF